VNKKFFHLLDLSIMHSYIILSSCDSKMDHGKLHMVLLEMSIRETFSIHPKRKTKPHKTAK